MGKSGKIWKRVPIFGKIEVGLEKESKTVYRCFNNHINRLKEIDHLGVLHYFLKIPRYTRYDYVMTMLYLIEKAVQSNHIKNNSLKLNDAYFTSVEEFLKCWCLLYCIGHFQMTFTAEHAFLRFLVEEEHEKEFLEDVKIRILNSEMFQDDSDEIKNNIYQNIEDKINNQEVMEIYKIFSLLKIIDNDACLGKYDAQIRELVKITILKKDYLQYLDNIDRKLKLEEVIDYFEIIRMLSFTILDGYVSQEYLKVNPFVVIENLDKFMEKNNYSGLLNDINKFYTADIYKSRESAYYHHRGRKAINESKIFSSYNLNELINDIIENKRDNNNEIKLDNEIMDIIKKEYKIIEGNEGPTQFMDNELDNSIRIKILGLEASIDDEIDYIQFPLFGGIMYNVAGGNYEIDIYPNSQIYGKSENKIFEVLKVVDYFYSTLIIPAMLPDMTYQALKDLFRILDNVSDFYNKMNEPENDKTSEIEPIKSFIEKINPRKSYFSSSPASPIFDHMETNNLVDVLDTFTEVASYVISNVIPSNVLHYSNLQLNNERFLHFPILFKYSELEKVIKVLKNAIVHSGQGKKLEMKKNIEILENEKENEDEGAFYIYAPNTVFKMGNKEREIDLLLIKILGASNKDTHDVLDQIANDGDKKEVNDEINKEIVLILGETKGKGDFDRIQTVDQLELVFGIPSRTANLLWEFKDTETGNIEMKIDSSITDDSKMLIFKKHEDFIE